MRRFMAVAHGHQLEQRKSFLLPFILSYVHDHHLGFAVLGDDEGLRVGGEVFHNLCGMALEVRDRLDLRGQAHGFNR
jgi:hypothetical protein